MNLENLENVLQNVTPQQLQSAISYLNAQELETKVITEGTTPQKMIQIWLDGRRCIVQELAAKYPKNPMGKSIEDCWRYITQLAQKHKAEGEQSAALTSFQVFQYAEKYFMDDSIKKEEKAATAVVKTSAHQKVDLQALLKEKEEWERAQKEKIDAWEQSNNAAIDKWDYEHPEDLFGFRPQNPFALKENPYLKEKFPKQSILDYELSKKPTSPAAAEPAAAEQTPSDDPEPDPDTIGELIYEEDKTQEQ